MKSKLLIVASFIIVLTGVSAAQMNETVLKQGKKQFNQASVPDTLGTVVGDQTINVDIKEQNGTERVGVDMEGVEVKEVKMGSFKDPTLEANVTMKQVEKIANSNQPIDKLNEMIKKEDIEYETNGAINSVKFFIAEKALSLASIF